MSDQFTPVVLAVFDDLSEGKTGGTYDMEGKRVTTGYVVGGCSYSLVINKEFFDSVMLREYLANHMFILSLPSTYIGYWIDGRKLWVDVVEVYDTEQQAGAHAKFNAELAFYDLHKDQEVRV